MLWIGARDYIEQRGFVVQECPACQTTGAFAVYDTKRRLTFYMVPTLRVRSQQVLECMTCHARFGVPDQARAALATRLLSHAELGAYGRAASRRREAIDGASRRNHYQVLQLDPDAEPETIEAMFKRLALKYHPDRSTAAGAPQRMRELIEARDVLADPGKRRAYDATLGIVRRTEALRLEEV